MGSIHSPTPVLLLLAVCSRYDEALVWARDRANSQFGPLALQSEAFAFTETDYYAATMGTDLRKQFFALAELVDPAELAGLKRLTNQWEAEYANMEAGQRGGSGPARPLNLDPGYLTEAKLVLASTKDHAHRIYLSDGIYAEVTLFYQNRGWRSRDWTFPDYRREDYQAFFSECRDYLRRARREGSTR